MIYIIISTANCANYWINAFVITDDCTNMVFYFQVTIFGQGSGATSIFALLSIP